MVLWYLVLCSEVFSYWDWGSEALWVFIGVYSTWQHRNVIIIMQKQLLSTVCSGPTSIGVLSLQTLSIQYMDLSDQLRVATHPRPTCLRRLVQSQLSGKERVYVIVRELLKPTGLFQINFFSGICFTLVLPATVTWAVYKRTKSVCRNTNLTTKHNSLSRELKWQQNLKLCKGLFWEMKLKEQ